MKKLNTILTIIAILILSIQGYSKTIYVATTGSSGNNGLTWGTAKNNIPNAVSVATTGDIILVKYGTYTLTSTIILSLNVKITSDDGNGTGWDDADPDSSQCILDGANLYRVMQFTSSSTTNSLVLRGFKIYRGNASTATLNKGGGGGILIKGGADPIIEGCWITLNYGNKNAVSPASYVSTGGGIFIQDSQPIIRNNRINDNYATSTNNPGYGGGICIYNSTPGSNPVISGNYIANNEACYVIGSGFSSNGPSFGGGLSVSMSSPIIEGNTFYNNRGFRRSLSSGSTDSYACGGAIALDQSSANIKDNTFNANYAFYENQGAYGNGATGRGGAIYLTSSNVTIENNVFYKNLAVYYYANNATYYGNAIESINSTTVIKNNIFSENMYYTYVPEACILSSPSAITISYNCFFNNYPNENVTSNNEVNSDPLFNNPTSSNFSLQSGSPCINAGDPNSVVSLGGEPVIDMGAEEYINITSGTVNSIDNSFAGNIISGKAFSIASESGTVNCTAQLYLSSPPNNPDGKSNIGRYWDISSTGNAKIRLYYPSSSTSGFTGSATIFHYNGTNWETVPTNAEQMEGTSKYVESTNPVTSWSAFTVGDSNDPLPVELTAFTANVINNYIHLTWQTAIEVNNYGFEIERGQWSEVSGQKSEWVKIGFVEGSGNSNSQKNYSFVDKVTASTIFDNFIYRLKQIDNDGAYKYSYEIEIINDRLPDKFALEQNYPNPFNPSTKIRFSIPVADFVTLKVYDILGNEITTFINEEKPAGKYEIDFNASNLSSGIYFYVIHSKDFTQTRKMLFLK